VIGASRRRKIIAKIRSTSYRQSESEYIVTGTVSKSSLSVEADLINRFTQNHRPQLGPVYEVHVKSLQQAQKS